MTIVEQLAEGIYPAYMPLTGRVSIAEDAENIAPIIKVVVEVDGQETTFFFVPYIEKETAGSVSTYIYEVDIQEPVQDALRAWIPLPVQTAIVIEKKVAKVVQVKLKAYLDNGSGLLVPESGETALNQWIVLNATRQPQESPLLDGYTSGERSWLSRRTSAPVGTSGGLFFLSCYAGAGNVEFEVKAYDCSGVKTSGRIVFAGGTGEGIVTIGVAPWQINGTESGAWSGGQATVDSSTVKYTIQAFQSSSAISQVFTLYPNDEGAAGQLLFLNSFGVYETLEIGMEESQSFDVDGNTFYFPRVLPSDANYLQSGQLGYLDKSGQYSFTVILPETRDAWKAFFQDFLLSPQVYLAQSEYFLPVTVRTGNFNLYRNPGQTIQISFSNPYKSQRV